MHRLFGAGLIAVFGLLIATGASIASPADEAAQALLATKKELEPPTKAAQAGSSPTSSPTSKDRSVIGSRQRALLYEEDLSNPKGRQSPGYVVWRTESVKAIQQEESDVAIRGDVVIPDRGLKMTISLKRNTDPTLPASHTVELTFSVPPDFPGTSVANAPGIMVKSNEQARGVPLAALAVKVREGFFLVGLSNLEPDRTNNIQMLKHRSWFDVPVIYKNQHRAIVAIEKGRSGNEVFETAFSAWDQAISAK